MKMPLALCALALLAGAVALPASASPTTLYDNGGPSNLTSELMNYGYIVSDSFTLAADSTLSSLTFYAWVQKGDTLSSAQWSIGSAAFGGSPVMATPTVSTFETSITSIDIYAETISLGGLDLSAGSYWITLQNAVTGENRGAGWDSNNGPSQAELNDGGGIYTEPSQSFSIAGTVDTTATPEPSGLLLMASGLASAAGMLRRKMRG